MFYLLISTPVLHEPQTSIPIILARNNLNVKSLNRVVQNGIVQRGTLIWNIVWMTLKVFGATARNSSYFVRFFLTS